MSPINSVQVQLQSVGILPQTWAGLNESQFVWVEGGEICSHISVSIWGFRGILSPAHNYPGLIFKVNQNERASKIIQLEIQIGVITSRIWLLYFIQD